MTWPWLLNSASQPRWWEVQWLSRATGAVRASQFPRGILAESSSSPQSENFFDAQFIEQRDDVVRHNRLHNTEALPVGVTGCSASAFPGEVTHELPVTLAPAVPVLG